MSKMLPLTMAVAFALTPVSLPRAAHAQSASAAMESCQALVDEGAYDSVGQCVSEMRTSPVLFCQFLKDIHVYPIFLYDPWINNFVTVGNQGQCVSLIRSF